MGGPRSVAAGVSASPASATDGREAAVERARTALVAAWERGERPRVEDFANLAPAGGFDAAELWDLAREEIRLRQQAGESPRIDEYHERFRDVVSDWPTLAFAVSPPTNLRPPPRPGDCFLDFELISEIGRGASGQVFLARQRSLAGRPVVLKFTREAARESETLARLQHTNVVPILSFHRHEHLNAVCMPYFGSTTLAGVLARLRAAPTVPNSAQALLTTLADTKRAARLRDQSTPAAGAAPTPQPIPPALRQRLERWRHDEGVAWIGARLADGLAHAHERGLLHLDLKPANALVSDEGQPMLLDFGLAVDTGGLAGGVTPLGGTLPYMAPEHLDAMLGEPAEVDERTDLFSLGVMLFELLTCRMPYEPGRDDGVNALRGMIDAREAGAPRVRSINPSVSPAIEAVVRKLLDPNPAKRYASARQVAEDLDRHLDDLPLRHAAEPSARERFGKWRRRNPTLASWAAASTLLAATIVVGAFGWAALEARNARLATVHAAAELRRAARSEFAELEAKAPGADELDARMAAWADRLRPFGLAGEPAGDDDVTPVVGRLGSEEAAARANLGEAMQFFANLHWLRSLRETDAQRKRAWVEDALRVSVRATAVFADGAVPAAAWEQRALLLNAAGRTEEADRLLARLEPEGPPEVRAALAEADALQAKRAWTDAGRKLRDLLAADPRRGDAWLKLGRCQEESGRDADALASYTVAVFERPTAYERHLNRGLVNLRMGRLADAERDFDAVIRLNPAFANGFGNRGLVRAKRGEHAAAVGDFTKAIELWPRQPKFWFLRADSKKRLGDDEGASADRTRGLLCVPDDAEGWCVRAEHRMEADPHAALRDLDEALKLDPDCRNALQDRAAVYDQLNRPAESLGALDRLLAAHPDHVPALAGRCVLLARKRDDAAARRDAERALALDPSPATQYQVAGCYALLGRTRREDVETAFRLLRAALRGGFGQQYLADDPDLASIRQDRRFDALLAATRQLAEP